MRRADLIASGVSPHGLRTAVAARRVERLGPGVYGVGADAATGAAVRFRAQIGCVTACARWSLPLWEPDARTHLVTGLHRSAGRIDDATAAAVVFHRTGRLPDPSEASALEALDQAAWCTSRLGQLVAIDAALARGLVRRRDLARLSRGDARRRAWVASQASACAESPLETVSRALLIAAGFRFVEQVQLGAARVDLLVEGRTVLEADGWAYHASRASFEEDRARDRDLVAAGFKVLRITHRDIVRRPALVVAQIAQTTGRRARPDWSQRWELCVRR